MASKSKSTRQISKITISVIGIGRVGLPLALFLVEKDNLVYGLDIDQDKVNTILKGVMPFMEEGAPELLKKHVSKNFIPTTNFENAAKSQVIILTLGTPVDENMNPSLIQIDKTLSAIKPYLKKGQLLILRSTVSPGTTDYVSSYLKDLGFIAGKNFFLAFCFFTIYTAGHFGKTFFPLNN